MEKKTKLEAGECSHSNGAAIDVDDAGKHGIDVAPTLVDLSESMKKELASMTKELASKINKPYYFWATILRVPEEMHNDDPGAYSPKVVSIGPFHRSRQNSLQHMEEFKWHYLGKFLDRNPEIDLQMYVQKIQKIERQARSYYKGNIDMESEEFVKMMVLDGCFIIQLLLQLEDGLLTSEDPIYCDKWTLPRVAHDMLLLENQLPFCVLEQLWVSIFGCRRDFQSLRKSVLKFFCNLLPGHDLEPPAGEVCHILHLLHSSLRATPDRHVRFDPEDRLPPPIPVFPHDPSEDGPHGSPVKPLEMVLTDPHDRRPPPMIKPKPVPAPAIDPHHRRPPPMSKYKPERKIGEKKEMDPHDRRPPPMSKYKPERKIEEPKADRLLPPEPKADIDPHDRRSPPMSKYKPLEPPVPRTPEVRKAEIDPHVRRPPPMPGYKPPPQPPKTIPTVTELQEAGVKFKRKEAKSFLEIEFKRGLMEIPRLTISDSTNSLFRNFIAFEQCSPWSRYTHFTSYCIFMDSLINTPRDVQLLYQSDVIEHVLGSDEDVAILFNKLCKGITWDFKNSYLANVSDGVIKHSQLKWPKWRAKLVRDYFSNPWAILSLAAAIFVIILASGQTFFAVLAYFRPPRS